jgi:hypothetical protein
MHSVGHCRKCRKCRNVGNVRLLWNCRTVSEGCRTCHHPSLALSWRLPYCRNFLHHTTLTHHSTYVHPWDQDTQCSVHTDVAVKLPVCDNDRHAIACASRQRVALSLRAYVEWLRRRYATCLGFVFFGRQDSCVSLLAVDHGVDADDAGGFLWLRLTEKMKRGSIFRRVIRLPLDSPPVRGHASLLPQLAALGRLYVLARELVSPSGDDAAAAPYLFQLPAWGGDSVM